MVGRAREPLTPYLFLPLVHLALILLPLAWYVIAVISYDGPDANIGAGMGMLGVAALGWPWSWWMMDGLWPNDNLEAAAYTAWALLNLALHTAIWLGARWWIAHRNRAFSG